MESQNVTRGSETPSHGKKEDAAPEQSISQVDTHGHGLSAAGDTIANPHRTGNQATNRLLRQPDSPSLSRQQILYLQRTIGNRATNRLLRKEDTDPASQTTDQPTIHTAPAGSIQRGWFDTKQEKAAKKQQKKVEWDTLLQGYSAAKAQGWIDIVNASVSQHVKQQSTAALKALEGDVRTSALLKTQTPINDLIAALNNQIGQAADDEQKRLLNFKLDRAKANLAASTTQISSEIKAKFAALVTADLPALLNIEGNKRALDQTALITQRLADLIAAQDKDDPKSEKDFDKEVKSLMQGKATTDAQTAAWAVVNQSIQDTRQALADGIADKVKTPVETLQTEQGTKKDAWNGELDTLANTAIQDWPASVSTDVNKDLPVFLKDKMLHADRKQALVAALKLAIAAQVATIEARLDGQIGTAADEVTKKRLQLEKAKVKERFGDKADALVAKNTPEYERLIGATITALLAQEDVKTLLNPAEFVKTQVRALLDPKRENQAVFSADVRKKVDRELVALKAQIVKQWTTQSQTKMTTYLGTKEAEITGTFITQIGIGTQTSDAGTAVVAGMDTRDKAAKLTVDEAYLKGLFVSDVLGEVTKYLAGKFGKDGMGWTSFRSDKAKEFRKRLKDLGRQQAYTEVEQQKNTHAKSSSMSTTGQTYVEHLAKNSAYKIAKTSVNDQMGILAEAEAILIVPEASVLFELDIAWRDASNAASQDGKKGNDLISAGKAAAKKRAVALFEEYKLVAKQRKNELFGKGAATDPRAQQSTTTSGDIDTSVTQKVTKDRVANRAITEAIDSDSVTHGYNVLANLINFMVPTPGDEVKIDLQMRIPGPDGASFFLFALAGKAGRETVDEVKVSLSVGVGGGLNFWGGEATFKVGYFVEAQADTASKVGMLMSYGTYRQMSSKGPIDLLPTLADYLWGGRGIKYVKKDAQGKKKANETNRSFAELWAAMVEETAMQRHFLPGTNPPTAVGDDAFREKSGRLQVTKDIRRGTQDEGREFVGKVSHIADTPTSVTAGGYSFVYQETPGVPGVGVQAVKDANSAPIAEGTKIYAADWTQSVIKLTTKPTTPAIAPGDPDVENQPIGKVDEITPKGTKIFVDGKSTNYVDVGYLVEAAGKVNFGVGKAEGVAAYKRLSRYSKMIIDQMALDNAGSSQFGKVTDIAKKRKDLGLDNMVSGGGQLRNILELEGKTEVGIGQLKFAFGVGGKFVWLDKRLQPSEVELQGSLAVPAEFLDPEISQANMIISRISGSFASLAKTLLSRALEQRAKTKEVRDDTGTGGKEVGNVVDAAADGFFPIQQLAGGTLGDELIKAGGETGRNETVNDTVRQWFTHDGEDTPIGKAINRFAMKNELAVTIKWSFDHGRNKISFDIKQLKGGEIDLGVFRAKIEKTKEIVKIAIGQDDTTYQIDTAHQPPTMADKGKVVYFKAGKITLDSATGEQAGKLVKVQGTTAIVRSWGPSGNILGFAL